MNDTGKTIAKNAGFLMVSQLMTWSMSILLMVFLPRYLGATSIGQLHLAGSVWAIIMIFVSFGMSFLLVKETARSKERFSDLAGTSLVIRFLFFFIAIGFLAVYLQWVNYSSQAVWVIVILGISNFVGQVGDVYQDSLVGNERMEYIAYADVAGKLFNTIASLILLFMGFGIIVISLAIIGSTFVQVTMKVYAVKRIQPIKLNFRRDLVEWILKASFPFFLLVVFRTIYIQLDVVIISWLV
ncbi:MAG: oligosaccharide flippase family protein, partial [Anaerolineae bacterium]|nr:oligosaccharide flippase family protein [Anaerolineae bacterium]